MLTREVQELRNAGATQFPVSRRRGDSFWTKFNDEYRGDKAGQKGNVPSLSFIRVRYMDFSLFQAGDEIHGIFKGNTDTASQKHYDIQFVAFADDDPSAQGYQYRS